MSDEDITPPARPVAHGFDLAMLPLIQAQHYTKADRPEVRQIVIHTAEFPKVPNAAMRLARRFAMTDRPASAHYCVDDAAVVRCVRDEDVAWHAPGANRTGIGIELIGYAGDVAAGWSEPYSVGVLATAAPLVMALCVKWSIPVLKLAVEDLKAGKRGICGHADVNQAFGKSSHTDPGAAFPWAEFLAAVLNA